MAFGICRQEPLCYEFVPVMQAPVEWLWCLFFLDDFYHVAYDRCISFVMLPNLFIFLASLFLIVKGATLATAYAGKLAQSFRLSKYIVGFIVVAVISILPETFISVSAAFQGMSAFGLGTLFGSNIADLTLVFALIVFFSGRGIRVESKILKNRIIYPFLLLLPLILGLDGYFSRLEGMALLIAGGAFYYLALKETSGASKTIVDPKSRLKSVLWLFFSMALLLIGSHFIVVSASQIAGGLGVNPVIIGMLIVGLGTTIPELVFSLNAVKKKDDSLAVGDILGTVLADATIVVGILALIQPFAFPQKIVYITGVFMVLASIILFAFMHSKRTLSRKEGFALFLFWLTFVAVEFFVNGRG